MKKILYICNSDWFFVSHRLPIAVEAKKDDFEIHIATKFSEIKIKEKLHSLGIKMHHLNIKRSSLNPLHLLTSFIQIIFLVYRIRPNIIHSITIKPVLLGGITSLFFPNTAHVAAITGLGYLSSTNSIRGKIIFKCTNLLYRISLLKKKQVVIFQNNDDLTYISRVCNLNTTNRILIPGSGVDLKEFTPNKTPTGKPIVLFAARLLKSKGIFEFVNAAEKSKGARFVIAGKLDFDNPDCIQKEILEEWVNKNIIEYWGYQKDMKNVIAKCTIITLPSFYAEGLPRILIEAAACGKPIVTTNKPGCRDAIIDGKTGLLIPAKDSTSLYNAIQTILKSSQLQKDMGKAARKFAENKFNISTVINTHLDIYNNLLFE